MSTGFLPEAAWGAEKVSAPRARPRPTDARRWPWATLVLAVFALFASSPQGAALFEWNRALSSAEPWRIWTGHFSHWSADHLVWDLAIFAVFGGLLELRSRRDFGFVLLASATLLGFLLPFVHPEMDSYRGLSGLDCAMACALAVSRLGDPAAVDRATGWAILGFVAIKAGLEANAARSFFVDQAAAGFVSLPAAHGLGAVVGVLVVALARPLSPKAGPDDEDDSADAAGGWEDVTDRGAAARIR